MDLFFVHLVFFVDLEYIVSFVDIWIYSPQKLLQDLRNHLTTTGDVLETMFFIQIVPTSSA